MYIRERDPIIVQECVTNHGTCEIQLPGQLYFTNRMAPNKTMKKRSNKSWQNRQLQSCIHSVNTMPTNCETQWRKISKHSAYNIKCIKQVLQHKAAEEEGGPATWKSDLEQEMWAVGFRYSWKKMEATARLNSFGNRTSPSNIQTITENVCLVSWAAAPCV